MQSSLHKIYRESIIKRVLDFLFLPKDFFADDSYLVKFTKSINYPVFSEILILLALGTIWYKSFLSNYLPFFNQSATPLVLVVGALVIGNKAKVILKKSHIYYLLFLAIALVSGLFASIRGISYSLIISGWLLFAEFGLAYFAVQVATNKVRLLKSVLFLSLPMTFMALYQFFSGAKTSSLWLSAGESQVNRVFGFLGSPNVLAAMIGIIVFLAVGLYFEAKNKSYLLIAGLNVFVVVLTFSRSAWLALILSALLCVLLTRPKYSFLSPLLLLALLSSKVRGRITTAFSASYLFDASLDGRTWAWINGTYILGKYPIFGTGPGTYGGQLALTAASPVYLEGIQNGYTALYFTDNQFLEILVQTGIVGFVLFLFFFISVGCELVSAFRLKHSKISLMAFGAAVFFVAASVFANNLEFTAVSLPLAIFIGAVNE